VGGGAVKVLGYLLLITLGGYLVALVEEWSSSGRLRPDAPLLQGLALLTRESLTPRRFDRTLFEAAPPLLLVAGVLALAVLPLAPGLLPVGLATGALWLNAALVYVAVALLMAGWGPDAAYAMIGGFRFLGQLIGYSMLVVMPVTAVAMRAESLLLTAIVESQAPLWNVLFQPLGLVLFLVAAMAVCYLPPFDQATAEAELSGGVLSEYTGVRLAVMRLARLVLILTLALSVTVFYLGGWFGPLLPPPVWSVLKTLVVAVAMLSAGRFLPRLRTYWLLEWGWKLGIPLALVNIFWVGVVLLVIDS
jgi:NADH-quinone oxidoreductase subunit H